MSFPAIVQKSMLVGVDRAVGVNRRGHCLINRSVRTLRRTDHSEKVRANTVVTQFNGFCLDNVDRR